MTDGHERQLLAKHAWTAQATEAPSFDAFWRSTGANSSAGRQSTVISDGPWSSAKRL